MADDQLSEQPPDYRELGRHFAIGMDEAGASLKDLARTGKLAEGLIGTVLSWLLRSCAWIGARIAATIADAEDKSQSGFQDLANVAIKDMFGVDVSGSLSTARGRGDNTQAANAIGGALIAAFSGQARGGTASGEMQPTDVPAKNFLNSMAQMALEGWLEGWMVEAMSAGFIKTFGDLDDTMSHVLGLGRASAAVHGPLVRHMIVTPLEWKIQKEHRPTLLGTSDILRAFVSGDYAADDAKEELSRLGYSDRRQDILLKQATRWLSASDALVLVRDGQADRTFAIENLRAQGFDQVGAEQALLIEELKHLSAIRDDSVASIKSAYVDRRISDGELDTYLSSIYASDEDRSAHITAFRTIRDLNTKRLSPGEAKAAVVAGVLPIAAYREALRLDGYDEEAVLTLELLLEVELDDKADVKKLREQKAADAAAADKARAEAAAKKAADVEQQRALARRGSLSELQRAVVRGLIPTSRYVEVLTPQYDADTVAALVGLVEQDRAAYVEQQARAADALKRASVRHIDIGALQAAYLAGVLTLDQVARQLASLTFDDADVGVLTATMQARKADLDNAKRQRDDAAAKAKIKSIDLGRFEVLVRRGHRTIPEYSALLSGLGYDAGAVAAMIELLQIQIADDAAARDARAAAAASKKPQGLTLEQIRRAVILGVATVDDFERYLVVNKFAIDAQTVLLAELRDDVTQAEAARAKRAEATDAAVETRVPIATVARAARLGIVAPDVYAQRLADAGYSNDDIAIEMDLLAVEIADVQAQRARTAAAEARTADRGLSLDQLAKAVKLGAAAMDDYRARAIELNYAAGDVDTLVTVLADEVQNVQDAEARHAAIAGQLTARNLSLAELDDAVKNGLMTIDAYTARLRALNFGADDADLLTTLLLLKLPAPPDTGGA